MKQNQTELVFILDRSGSMCGLEADTIGGYNAMLEKQKKVPGAVTVTTVLFDDRYELLHYRVSLQEVAPITEHEYYVRGCTALLDAIGKTIVNIREAQKSASPEHQADKVLFVITTDGMENASREFSYEKLRSLVEQQQKQGWEFLFLGANIDAIGTAQRFGIAPDRAVDYHADHAGTQLSYEVISDTISHVRACSAPLGAGWKSRIEQDFQSRKAGK